MQPVQPIQPQAKPYKYEKRKATAVPPVSTSFHQVQGGARIKGSGKSKANGKGKDNGKESGKSRENDAVQPEPQPEPRPELVPNRYGE